MTAATISGSVRHILSGVVVAAVMLSAGGVLAQNESVIVTGDDGIRVWVEQASDVFVSYEDVVVAFRPVRDCFATVYVVDTGGFVHVVYPFSRAAGARVRGGVTYRYTAHDLGLDVLCGEGIAYVFAVGSPQPLSFARWDDDIFAGRYGYRVCGDPYIASRQFYLSLLPARCEPALISVSATRFYVGHWERYPSYLCNGGEGFHVRVGEYCRACSPIYDRYRFHAAAPDQVLHPRADVGATVHTAFIKPASRENRHAVRPGGESRRVVVMENGAGATRTRVVSTSRTVRESKAEYREKLRQKSVNTPRELASARTVGAGRELVKEQRVTKGTASASKGAANMKSDSDRNEEGKARSASKAR